MQTEMLRNPMLISEGFRAWLLEKSKQHPVGAALVLATLSGGSIVLYHFYTISYLPVLAVSDLVGVVMASATIGLLVLIAIAAFLMAPGLLLVYWRRHGIGSATSSRCQEGRVVKQRWKHSEFAMVTASAAIVAVAALSMSLYLEVFLYVFLVALVVPLTVFVSLELSVKRALVTEVLRKRSALFCFQLCCYFIVWSYTALLMLLWPDQKTADFFAVAALLVVGAIVLHLVILRTADMKTSAKFVVPTLTVVYLVVFTGLVPAIANRTIGYLALGHISRVDIALTKTGCDTVNAIWSKRPCVMVTGGSPDSFLLPDVDLLTRIGPQYLIAERGTVANLQSRRSLRIAIRSEDVLGWARVKKENPPK